jgi:tRNA dimethylallyltransferase
MAEPARPPIIVIAGPTASGKSGLALAVAEALGGTIINADSMQIYRDLAILTARPGAAELARAPHRLYGVIDAAEVCSAGRWRALALAEIAAAHAAGRLPILTGGSGLYLQALLQGLAPVPAIPPEIRAAARALHAELGPAAFHRRLAERDPAAAARLFPGDTLRLVRAFEVVTATGSTLADWQRRQSGKTGWRGAAIALLPPRAPLYAACDARLLRMVEEGAAEEVAALLARRLPEDLPAMRAVGVRELGLWLAGASTRAAAVAAAQQATRRYAKRQYTWLRHRLPASAALRRHDLIAQFSESIVPEILAFIRQALLTA